MDNRHGKQGRWRKCRTSGHIFNVSYLSQLFFIFGRVEIVYLLTVFVAGIAVAFINTISAAGSLVSLSALMFAGLSPAEANATNRIPIIFQSYFSVKGFESKGVNGDSYKWWLALASVPGAVMGAWVAIKIPDDVFQKILLGVMLFFLVVTVVNPLKPRNEGDEKTGFREKLIGVVLYVIIGIYGGFIQAGSGFFLMAPMLLLHRFDIHKTNYYKVFITFIYTFAALAVFLWKGNIYWGYGLVMSAGTSLGGWLTSRWSVSVDEIWMKRIIVSLILLMTLYVWFGK